MSEHLNALKHRGKGRTGKGEHKWVITDSLRSMRVKAALPAQWPRKRTKRLKDCRNQEDQEDTGTKVIPAERSHSSRRTRLKDCVWNCYLLWGSTPRSSRGRGSTFPFNVVPNRNRKAMPATCVLLKEDIINYGLFNVSK